MHASPRAWRPLPARGPADSIVPRLLVSAVFAPSAYDIRVTDLAHVWRESVDRKGLFKRSYLEGSPIELSDGADQIERLLKLLAAALDPAEAEHGTCSLALSRRRAAERDDELVLVITCDLPRPLEPLTWPVYLARAAPSAVTAEVVLPLVGAQWAYMRELEALRVALREKDGVIGKLADQIEKTSGLEQVFAVLPGKRRATRAVAESRVRGLAPFREREFRKRLGGPRDAPRGGALLDSVFGGAGGLACEAVEVEVEVEGVGSAEEWWLSIDKGTKMQLVPDEVPKSSGTLSLHDGFQVQATPPQVQYNSTRKQHAAADEETTDGEDDDDEPIPDSNPPPKCPAAAAAADDTTASSADEDPAPVAPPSQTVSPRTGGRLGRIGRKRKSPRPELSPAPPPPPLTTTSTRARGTRLGRIGGGARRGNAPIPEREPSVPAQRHHSPSSPQQQGPETRRHHRLGAVGRRGGEGAGEAAVADRTPKVAAAEEDDQGKEQSEEEEEEETAEERVARRRAELQKKLQKKAAAGPAKKKRKF
ncbi:hypothetical protein P8C59_008366 [Phyllachora maydis]|uniref:Non-homologous end-joining factor 1 n=1 Tax=Phyllachora maydis TaxID=1825666 RepID=A0AAD9IAA3_9PEZI|nr:hypothetical protein P8C59_008366 [Phyllachora maydis]